MAVPQGPFYKAMGQRLRDARRTAKLTQEKLADAIGLSRTSITNIETGRQPLHCHVLVHIAEVLGVNPADLIPATKASSWADAFEGQLRNLEANKRDWVVRFIEPRQYEQERPVNGTKIQPRKAKSDRIARVVKS
jgi:transcriptional regulator with XRE-family HTH domain